MGDVPYPFTPSSSLPPPPPPSPHKPNMPMFYYGLVIVGTAAVVLAVYNLIIIKWCTDHHRRSSPRRHHRQGLVRAPETSSSRSFDNPNNNKHLVSSFRYKKKGAQEQEQDEDFDDYDECPVCLCVFEEGEEVRQLPRCKHNFHAACIDMWLFSHFDCPVCRGPVEPPVLRRQTVAEPPPENSRDGLLDTGILDPV